MVAAVFSAALVLSGAASAAITAHEQAELDALTPAVRAEVEARLAGGQQTVRGILDTMLLNSISLLFASGRIVAADFDTGVVVVEGTNAQVRAFNFDVTTLVVKT
jgi:hypothetical protein